ncbi:Uncharacterised protein [Mycobacteroides abscessus subsp. abscessus]|nr:Uncharacterised protein [Mycobacteroides abscessus subsp. abscessus]
MKSFLRSPVAPLRILRKLSSMSLLSMLVKVSV